MKGASDREVSPLRYSLKNIPTKGPRKLQIPRLPRISCRELRLRSTACGSLKGEPHKWSLVRAVKQEIRVRS